MFIGAKPCCSSEKFQNSSANNSSPDTIHWWKSWDLWTHMKYEVLVAQLYPTFCDPWTVWSLEFSRPQYCSGEPFPSWGDLPNPGIEPGFPALQTDALPSEPPGKLYEHIVSNKFYQILVLKILCVSNRISFKKKRVARRYQCCTSLGEGFAVLNGNRVRYKDLRLRIQPVWFLKVCSHTWSVIFPTGKKTCTSEGSSSSRRFLLC